MASSIIIELHSLLKSLPVIPKGYGSNEDDWLGVITPLANVVIIALERALRLQWLVVLIVSRKLLLCQFESDLPLPARARLREHRVFPLGSGASIGTDATG